MKTFPRRTFIKLAAGVAGSAAVLRFPRSAWAQPVGANEAVRFGVIGIGWKGGEHVKQLAKTPGVRITALCDVDPARLAPAVEALRNQNTAVFATTDARALLERQDVDAVLIATCNHWHALLTVWACQAGKDVYVEKPVSHTIWEGQQMVAAAAKYGRIVQTGTQLRSDTGIGEAVRSIRAGELGRIQSIHGVCYTHRASIGRRMPWYPEGLDYDRWCGPAPCVPLTRKALHYDWHWQWDTGNGDMANIGAHVMDIARRFVGPGTQPRRVLSLGGRFGVDDAGETANSQLAFFDYAEVPVIFESRALPAKAGVTYMDQLRGIRTGVVVQCEGGYYAGYIGGALWDNDRRQIRKIPGDGGATHIQNFVSAIRSRRASELTAPIEVGHASSSLCHWANVSYRLGRTSPLPEVGEPLRGFSGADTAIAGLVQHLRANGIDATRDLLQVGPWVPYPADPTKPFPDASGTLAGRQEELNYLVRGVQRPPYVIPDSV